MPTFTQYTKNHHRKTKIFKSSTPKFEGSPFKIGTCTRVGTVKPKKPNSAQRKIAKVQLVNDRYLIAYIPGFGHNLKKNSEVLVRGGRVPDLPGCRYHIVRNKKDLNIPEAIKRFNRRSKFGLKNPFKEVKMSRHNQNRKDARDRKKNFKDWDDTQFKRRIDYYDFLNRKLKAFFI